MFYKDNLLETDYSTHSTHQIIPKLIADNSMVLDVGCNTGMLGKMLQGRNITIDGIDINREAVKKAEKYYRNIYIKNLSKTDINIKDKYDYIVMADILEHLPRPDLLLKNVKNNFTPKGVLITSIPNIARIEIRLKLLVGQFKYAPGILSSDHLRFFTKKSMLDLLTNSGYEPKIIVPTGLGHILKILPNLTAFQFVILSTKK